MVTDVSISSTPVSEQWKALVVQYSNQFLHETAKFYAERYYAETPNEESLLLLAQCHYRLGKFKQAYMLLSESKYLNSPANKYLFAVVCVHLGKFDEAEYVLHANNRLILEEELTKENMSGVPGGAGGLYLLGKICRRQQRKETAVQYFKLALELDPLLWSAVVELSEMGVEFKIDEVMLAARDQRRSNGAGSPRILTRSASKRQTTAVNNNNPTTAAPSSSHSNRDLDNQAAKAFLLQTAESLTRLNNNQNTNNNPPTPILPPHPPTSSSAVPDYSISSVVSIKLPFATPSSLPSPITASMLSGGRNLTMPQHDATSMVISPYDSHSLPISDEVSGHLPTSSLLHSNPAITHNLNTTNASNNYAACHYYSRGGGMNSVDVNPTRAPLFGLPTPTTAGGGALGLGADDPSQSALGLSYISGDVEGDQSTIMELHSTFQPSKTGGERRRVSFGPTARLSFSGAFDSHLPNPTLLDSFDQSSKIVTAETDDHPHKLQRSDARKSPNAASNKSGGIGNDRAPPSPFPMSLASPIAGNVSALPGGDEASRHHLSVASSRPYDSSLVYDESASLIMADAKPSHTNATTPFPPPPLPPATTTSPRAARSGGSSLPSNTTSGSGSSAALSLPSSLIVPFYEIDESIWNIVCTFARALQQINNYSCIESIDTLQQLPARHYQTALVSQLVGRACTEMNEYKGAVIAFREMRRLEPFRTQGIELFSSALWHLREDKELAALAQQAVEVDKYSAETWCVVGNCFSLQKETDMAIKFFQRALQIDPYFTYAHTLCGHEHVNNEDMEKAITSFRTAILCNERHYNAWYGLGSIYYRQERFEMSEYHFRRARAINPRSSVLDCYLGMALNAQGSFGKVQEALDVLNEASIRDPHNPQLRFQRAHILLSQDRLEQALEELLLVEKYAPKEPPVHAMLGQIYQRTGETQKALLHLNIAMDLDPKEINSLKAIMENFDEPQLVA